MNFIPEVENYTVNETQTLNLNDLTSITFNTLEAKSVAELLKEYLINIKDFNISSQNSPNSINLFDRGLNDIDENDFATENYTIIIDEKGVNITGDNRYALCRGIQTLRQIIGKGAYAKSSKSNLIPFITLNDGPKFKYRGLMLDVSRHFFSVEEVCRFIELMAQYKFNRFHWHLTDNQGWRIEIKKYPKLTEIASKRNQTQIGHYWTFPHKFDKTEYGGFYTQEDIKKVVEFADRRGIVIIPEIDMPGHMEAALFAYPEWGNNLSAPLEVKTSFGGSRFVLSARKSTIEAMQNICKELMALFPSKYIHLGGDEARKDEWINSYEMQELMAELNLDHVDKLQSYFIKEMSDYLQKNGRVLVGWDEILEGGLCNEAVVTCWREDKYAVQAARNCNYVINCGENYSYFDRYQADAELEPLAFGSYIPSDKVYGFPVIPKELEEKYHKYIIGGQGQLWTEYIPNMKQLEYMTYPRACALSEVLWYKGEKLRLSNFVKRLNANREILEAQKVNAHDLP